ncbi:predicted protein [Naegleria gruberi]|uniref:Predicted protein n=1 Tax=Naegleria gruberi TaxID=5762 RepID=D2VVT9_NAEGR|nr:uncharacterized protein NAEGRDRAFT_73138 [Naegleria gruberi]EFC39099.1 predicted protein [Naegleria gruberi]|eukprot:XP_002671843.1 predicted protein [Naegleria gruberi strain NEG-M]
MNDFNKVLTVVFILNWLLFIAFWRSYAPNPQESYNLGVADNEGVEVPSAPFYAKTEVISPEKVDERKESSVIVKGASGYKCILPPTETNKQFFAVGENYYSGSSEMLKFICEYLKRRNLVQEIIPKSRKMMKRLIYETHLMEMVGLRDAVMKRYANSLIDNQIYFGGPQIKKNRRFVIRIGLIRKAIIEYCKRKPPSFINNLDTPLRAALFNIRNELRGDALFLFINLHDQQILREISREIVSNLPQYLSNIGNSSDLSKMMKEKLAETVYKMLQRYGNKEISTTISLELVASVLSENKKLFNNYENCFTNHSTRPMLGCFGFIKNMPKPLYNAMIKKLFERSGEIRILCHNHQISANAKEKFEKMFSLRLDRFLKKL